MNTLQLKDQFYWIGSLDPDLRVFDVIMHTEFGTTYNAYLLKGSDKTALFETVKVKCWDAYKKRLEALVDLNTIDYIIVDHTEPDHAGSIEHLLKLAPQAKIVGSQAALRFLRAISNTEFECIPVSTGDTISLGDKTIEFVSAPFLHWPDSIYSYIVEDKTLVTCDSFGAHYSFEPVLSSKITQQDDYMSALKYYYTMIMGPFKPHVLSAIEKIEHLDIDMICPGHGPVLDEDPWQIVNIYKEWSTEHNPLKEKTVVIPYVSAYGYTESLAQQIAKGIQDSSDIQVELYDMVTADPSAVLSKIHWADGVLFGSPTINGDALPPIWNLVMQMSPIVHGRKWTGCFGSYGWSGEAVPNLEGRLKSLRMKIHGPGFKVNFKPSAEELQKAFTFGEAFRDRLLNKDSHVASLANLEHDKSQSKGDGSIKQWRCVVCNEVFEGVEPPDICPACGASSEQFEEYIIETVTFQSDSDETFIIIGNGAAGLSAAEAIRERNPNASIDIISAENHLTYYRPMLSDYLSDSHDKDVFFLHDEAWYKDNNIQLHLNTKVEELLPQNREIRLEDGSIKKYDRLILANGSHSFVPPITDIRKQGVFTLKTIEDANILKENATKGQSCVVIGGGLLGLEAAWELRKRGLQVAVVEQSDRVLPMQLDNNGSSLLEEAMNDVDIQLYKNTAVNAILGDAHVEGVLLDDGETISCDLVLVSTGVRANTKLATNAGILAGRGIIVNERMETNLAGIYAAGDVIEFDNQYAAIWPFAVEQGKVAGANAVGDSLAYNASVPSNVFNGMGMKIYSIGDIGYKEKVSYKELTDLERIEGLYKKLIFKNNTMVGGILIGDVSQSIKLIRGVNRLTSMTDMIKEVLL